MNERFAPALLIALPGASAETRAQLTRFATDCAVRGQRVHTAPPRFDSEILAPGDVLIVDLHAPQGAWGSDPRAVWEKISVFAPRVVVTALPEEQLAPFEAASGRRFDLVLAAGEARTTERLREACAELGVWTQVGLWGGAAGSVEMSVGAVLHGMNVPLRGAALCSVQAAMLTLASARLRPVGRVAWVAFIAAGLKAFSPGGGRVRPMVAITVQGALFSAAVQALGWNFLSVALGGVAIGCWSALQGFFLQYLLLGDDLVQAYARVVRWLAESWQITAPSLPVLLVAWAALHGALAGTAALLAWRWRAAPRALRKWVEREPQSASRGNSSPVVSRATLTARVAKEFARWQFWLPLVVVAVVLLATGRSWESVAWLVARFVAVGAVVFALIASFRPARFVAALRRRGWWGPAAAFEDALGRATRRG